MSADSSPAAVISVSWAAQQQSGYSALYQREFPRVVRTIFLIVRDQGCAEELAQESFIQLLMHWKKVERYDRPEAWVRRVAVRLAVRYSRRERLRGVLERKGTPQPAVDNGVDLSGALAQLSALQRAAVVLYYYEDRPLNEVAEVLGCSVNTVKSHLYRARNTLKTLISPHGTVSERSGDEL